MYKYLSTVTIIRPMHANTKSLYMEIFLCISLIKYDHHLTWGNVKIVWVVKRRGILQEMPCFLKD